MSKVPYAETLFWQGWKSPFWNESHKTFRTAIRAFLEKEVYPIAQSFDETDKEPSLELMKKVPISNTPPSNFQAWRFWIFCLSTWAWKTS